MPIELDLRDALDFREFSVGELRVDHGVVVIGEGCWFLAPGDRSPAMEEQNFQAITCLLLANRQGTSQRLRTADSSPMIAMMEANHSSLDRFPGDGVPEAR